MRVLHVLSSNVFSGAENVACQIIKMFSSEADVEMAYCSPFGPIQQVLLQNDITYYPIKKNALELMKIVDIYKPDVIHAHDMKASFICAILFRNYRIISHIHNNSFDSRKPSAKAILYATQIKHFNHIFWVSKSALDNYYFKSKVMTKSSVLMNIIDIVEVQKKADIAEKKDRFDILYLGRLSYPKNPERLIDVFAGIIKKNHSIKIGIVGNGELEHIVHQKIRDYRLESNIECLGFVNNPYGILKNASMLMMTSRWEGTPMCALEAMALGTPIVSTPTDGLLEIVVPNVTGYLSDLNDELVEHCLNIVGDVKLRESLSIHSIKRAEELMDISRYRGILLEQYNNKI